MLIVDDIEISLTNLLQHIPLSSSEDGKIRINVLSHVFTGNCQNHY